MKKVLLITSAALLISVSGVSSADLVDNSSVRVNAVKSNTTGTTASNNAPSTSNPIESKKEYCQSLSNLSGAIMKQRQIGTDKKSLETTIANNPLVVVRQQGAVMIEVAYNKPLQDSVEDKNKAIESFEKEYYNYCLSL